MINEHVEGIEHVANCPDCQARSTMEGIDVDLDKVWRGVSAEVWSRSIGRLERWLTMGLRSPGLARALLTTPSLMVSWVAASAVVLGVGAFFTVNSEVPWVALLAPALAGIGIAYSYGPGVDPAWELSKTMPISDRAILLTRCLAVFAVNAVLTLVAGLFADQALGLALTWLVPMTTVSALALAVSTWTRSPNIGVAGGLGGWALVILASSGGLDELGNAVSHPALLPVYGIATFIFLAAALYATSSKRVEASKWRQT